MIKNVIRLILVLISGVCLAQTELPAEIRLGGSETFQKIMRNPNRYRVEIIYTTIETQNQNEVLTTYRYGCDSTQYFYPASLVKLPCSILSFEKINQLASRSKTHTLLTDSINPCQHKTIKDTSSINQKPMVEHYIRKMLLVSDNHAFGRIYEWLGPDYLNQRLWQMGFNTARIVHRFDGKCKGLEQLNVNPIRLYSEEGALIESRTALSSKLTYLPPMGEQLVGNAHLNEKGKKILKPKDFSAMNFLLLNDVHEMMQNLIKPKSSTKKESFQLNESQRQFLLEAMRQYPRESESPRYDSTKYRDNFKKYLIYGNRDYILNDSIIIYNMVGQSHGFMADCAYIVDQKYDLAFFLSARIYVNEDGIINDGRYEYKSIALPWFSELGQRVLNYERKMKRKQQKK